MRLFLFKFIIFFLSVAFRSSGLAVALNNFSQIQDTDNIQILSPITLRDRVPGSGSGSGVIFVDSASESEFVDLEGVRQPRASSSSDSLSKAVSSNITNILESLLKNYDKTERPSFQNGEPTKVNVNILIRSMGPISEMQMYYSMDCYFRQYWRDQRLSFKGLKNNANNLVINQLSLNVAMLEKIWKPDTYFHNGLDSYLHSITRPNKLLRISENGDITYSIRLTVKAKCPMILRNFPMDQQTCPLVLGSFAYTAEEVQYNWLSGSEPVGLEGDLQMSQFDLQKTFARELNFTRHESVGSFSVLQVVFLLQRHTGYFLIQVYLPCALIVVLSWVGFWLNREATSDRVTLGVTAVLTLSAISMDSRSDLPKVHYATALDWFIICSFLYCVATILEFAGVHYFTKVGSGERFGSDADEPLDTAGAFSDEEDGDDRDNDGDDEWEDVEEWRVANNVYSHQRFVTSHDLITDRDHDEDLTPPSFRDADRKRTFSGDMINDLGPVIDPLNHNCISVYNKSYGLHVSMSASCDNMPVIPGDHHHCSDQAGLGQRGFNGTRTETRHQIDVNMKSVSVRESKSSLDSLKSGHKIAQTQTEKKISFLQQFRYCFMGNEKYRKDREKKAVLAGVSFNSVSKIDSCARLLFPLSFMAFNLIYWTIYFTTAEEFSWGKHAVKGNIGE